MPTEVRVTAALLRQGRSLDRLSGALLLLGCAFALGQLLLEHRDPLLASVCLLLVLSGALQKYWALRVAFDAELFGWLESDSLSELDAALRALGLIAADRSGCPLQERSLGALRLLRRQAVCVASQALLAVAASACALLAALAA